MTALLPINPNTALARVAASLPSVTTADGKKVRHIDLQPPAQFFWRGERYQRKNNGQSVKLADGSVHAFDFAIEVTPAAKPIPATLKCPEPNLTSLLEDALDAAHSFGMECARDKNAYDYGDEPDTRKLFAEVKRLEAAAEVMETATGALLVLSLMPQLVEALRDLEMGANTVAACYTRNPGNFAAALRDLGDYADKARKAIAAATSPASVEAVAKFADAVKEAGQS